MSNAGYIEEEILIIQHYGEIPEVGYHGSLHYLGEDPEGPGLTLGCQDLHHLRMAVVAAYRRIIARDLDPANRGRGLYRGLQRCALNWERLALFCRRQALEEGALRREVASLLENFLARELEEVQQGGGLSAVNCPAATILQLAGAVGLPAAALPRGWQGLCPESP